jgi:hypothetical protein
MLIEHTCQREGGTHVEILGTPYHFAPSESDPRHLADVRDPDHIRWFLAIRGFVPADGEPIPAPVAPEPPKRRGRPPKVTL